MEGSAMIGQAPASCYAAVGRLTELLDGQQRMFRGSVERSSNQFGEAWLCELGELVACVFPDEPSLEQAVKGYASFAMDSLRRQFRFENERRYPAKTFAEAAQEVYLNEGYMVGQYLPGLLLSHYLWSHHYRQIQFFASAFLSAVRVNPDTFAEIGVGTGVYSRMVLRALPDVHGVGFDLSPYSKAFAETHLERYGVSNRFELHLRDVVLEPPARPFRWLICVEVLEHLEDPVSFLRGVHSALLPGGKAFVTAALNAAHADHIYLYESGEAVAGQLRQAGFVIEQSFCANAYRPEWDGQPVPAAAAFIVTR